MKKRILAGVLSLAIALSGMSVFAPSVSAEDWDIGSILKTNRTESSYNTSFLSVPGFAKGVVSDRTEYLNDPVAYRKVATGDEFVKALDDARAGTVKVIEVTDDIDLGYYALSEEGRQASCVEKYEDPNNMNPAGLRYTNPTIKASGVSKISVADTHGLTVFSQTGNTIYHAEFKLQYGSDDLIFRNLKFDDVWQFDEADNITIHKEVGWSFFKVNGAKNVWLDHCTFTIGADALIDLENAASGVTYSWCRFSLNAETPDTSSPIYKTVTYMEEMYQAGKLSDTGRYSKLRKNGASVEQIMQYEAYHSKGFGVGNEKQFTDSRTGNMPEDSAKRVRLTMAYNYLTNIGQRVPRLSVGRVHMMNLYVDNTTHTALHNTQPFVGYGQQGANQCIDVHTAGSCAADTCVFNGVNKSVVGKEYQGFETSGTGLSSDARLSKAWSYAKNRAVVFNSTITNSKGTYTGSSWDNNGNNLLIDKDYWNQNASYGTARSTINNWAWQLNIIGEENMTRDDYPEYFEFEDDYDAELGYDYQVLPLDEVEDTVTKYAGAFVYNMSAEDWLRVSYDEGEDIAPVSGTVLSSAVSIRQEDQVVAVGDLVQFDVDVKPGNVSNRTVKWSSSNPDVMEVLDSGLVKVKTSGSVVITAEAADGTGVKDSVTLTAQVAVEEIVLDRTKTIYAGETAQLVATVLPENAANKDVKWTSSNTNVATVDENGLITGIQEGNATITCSSVDNPDVKARLTLKVKAGSAASPEPTDPIPTDPADPTPTPPVYTLGDVNHDGVIDASDALCVLKHAAKLEVLEKEEDLLAADVNGDSQIDASDALLILQKAAGIIEEL